MDQDSTGIEIGATAGTALDSLRAARDGDERAARNLVSRHGPSMMRTAWRVLGRYGGDEAEDVVQEAFIAALTTSALPRREIGAWLRAITTRKALDSLRATTRRGGGGAQWGSREVEDLAVDRAGVGDDVLAVRQGLARLSPRDRAVLTLIDLEGWSMGEAARILGSTGVAIRLRAVRARRKLARILRDRGVASAPGARGRRSEGS